jgi:hypothetical protein
MVDSISTEYSNGWRRYPLPLNDRSNDAPHLLWYHLSRAADLLLDQLRIRQPKTTSCQILPTETCHHTLCCMAYSPASIEALYRDYLETKRLTHTQSLQISECVFMSQVSRGSACSQRKLHAYSSRRGRHHFCCVVVMVMPLVGEFHIVFTATSKATGYIRPSCTKDPHLADCISSLSGSLSSYCTSAGQMNRSGVSSPSLGLQCLDTSVTVR